MLQAACRCGQRVRYEAAMGGKKVRCPKCGGALQLPAPEPPAPAPDRKPPPAGPSPASPARRAAEPPAAERAPSALPPEVEQKIAMSREARRAARRAELLAARRTRRRRSQRPSFRRLVPGAFAYPFVPNGLLACLLGVILTALGVLLATFIGGVKSALPLLPFLFIIGAGIFGYAVKYLLDVVGFSAGGSDEPPGAPDANLAVENVLVPLLFGLGVAMFSWGAYALACGAGAHRILRVALLVAGNLYTPAAMLSVAMDERARALNPFRVLRAFAAAPLPFALPCGLYAGSVSVAVLYGHRVLSALGEQPVFGAVALAVVLGYVVLVAFRLVGLVFYAHEERLSWME